MSLPVGYNQTQSRRVSPQAQESIERLLSMLQGSSGDAVNTLAQQAQGTGGAYNAMEEPAYRNFQQNLLPQIAGRFQSAGMLDSSAFANASTGAASNLASELSAQRSQLQQQSLYSLLGLEQSLINSNPYDYGLQQKPESWLQKWGPTIGKTAAGAGLGYLTGGPLGAVAGGVAALSGNSDKLSELLSLLEKYQEKTKENSAQLGEL